MEELSEDTILVKDALQGLLKAKKLLRMYPPNNPIYIKTAEEAYSKFKNFFQLNNELSLKIRQNEIIFNNDLIYHNPKKDDNLALFFFKDGIKEISFLTGLSQKEFEDFIKILNTDFENVALNDDVVTLLWERNFEHIKYVADEDFIFEEDEHESEKIYEEAKNKICSDEDILNAYHEGLKTVEKQPNITVPIGTTELTHISKEIEKEETSPKIDKVIVILFELLYQAKNENFFPEIANFIKTAVAYCVENGDFKRASFILDSVKAFIEDSDIGEENIKILRKIFTAINSEAFIQEIGRIIDSEKITEDNELIDFVKYLDKTSIPFFMQLMGELQSIKGRRLLINILTIVGKLDIKTIANGLYDNRWYVVRNTITILGKIADTTAVEYLTKTLSHPDQRVRKEVIKIMGNIGGPNILSHLKNALNDSNQSVRITAARMLGNTRNEFAKKIILAELSKKKFLSKDFSEKKEFYEAISHWRDQDVIDFLLSTVEKKRFWKRAKNDESRACAAYALGIIGDRKVVPFLEKVQNSKNKLLKTFTAAAIKQLTA